MKQIKIISSNQPNELEEKVNEALKINQDGVIVDIK